MKNDSCDMEYEECETCDGFGMMIDGDTCSDCLGCGKIGIPS